ncbi:hypothetical protein CLAFUW4_03830 [Fulvia fulva]|uniref:BHLH domain-containing protein n=1 Tax=Passalora fulva TaxID=5499 RepID=A0A9Q8P607_PASFU|nr:uncharacterized protein CLAFUR5_03802 [Fulvia fulva]KAK4630874.1 hypothetical protein CLAFUR4_03818 [Fulvia fulva]KAK4633372.1 hypothetical protein CLAFUR0_03817 [Fulvia fulva]UJO14548.1 hypothetical protein CLAFUR5_03802 [Fulvia fulva]WPV11077.1 hypothetical protein CLAFUW4_03830 [Fulvia fulva]WPV26044.1 hypothetical protein CLAFUW7_03822 [Fulvia fulva]
MAAAVKRKRGADDLPDQRPAPGMHESDFGNPYQMPGEEEAHHDMNFAAALSHHNNDMEGHEHPQHDQGHHPQGHEEMHEGGIPSASDTAAAAMAYHTMTVPQSTESAFMTQPTQEPGDRPGSAGVDPNNPNAQRTSSFGDFDNILPKDGQNAPNGNMSPGGAAGNQSTPKPQVGTEEWHKVRRDNHKEVERRRRETINEGINELAKIVPGCEKNKGSILARAVQFITQLKENETQNIEKWTLEKLLTEQAIAELSSSCDKLKAECQRAWGEAEQWKKAAQKAGVSIEDEKADADAEDAE